MSFHRVGKRDGQTEVAVSHFILNRVLLDVLQDIYLILHSLTIPEDENCECHCWTRPPTTAVGRGAGRVGLRAVEERSNKTLKWMAPPGESGVTSPLRARLFFPFS